jgi:hypothetical protein
MSQKYLSWGQIQKLDDEVLLLIAQDAIEIGQAYEIWKQNPQAGASLEAGFLY